MGKVKSINTQLITSLAHGNFIPIIAPTGLGDNGETYNINADIVAGEIAAALKAEKLLLLTDVPGVLSKKKELIHTMTNDEALNLIEDGTIEGGMFPKVKCCLKALNGGVQKAHIVDGRLKHADFWRCSPTRASEQKSFFKILQTGQTMNEQEVIAQATGNIMNTYRRFPIVLTKGSGARVWDINGKEYLDLVAGIAVCNLGHSHPQVIAAVKEQLDKLTHVSNLYYTQPQTELAELLIRHSFADKVFFCNSGARPTKRPSNWRASTPMKIWVRINSN